MLRISAGFLAVASAADDWTLVLHPPSELSKSFVEGPAADFSVALHGADTSSADAKGAVAALARAENAREQAEAAQFAEDKKLILRKSFLEPLAPLGTQEVSQAALPLEVNVNYDSPTSFIAGDSSPSASPVVNLHLESSFTAFPTEVVAQIDASLTENQKPVFHEMLKRVQDKTNAAEAVAFLAQENAQKIAELNREASSFMAGSALEIKANACNYGRLLSQAAYALANVESHILSVLTTVTCGCVYIGTFGECILSKISAVYPVCESINNVRESAFGQSVQLWESVKAKTKSCNMHSIM